MTKIDDFIIIYIFLFLSLIFFLLLFLFGFYIKIDFVNLENNKEIKSTITITHIEGNEVYYRYKNKIKKRISYYDEIKKNVTIETGDNSNAGFYIKDQGFYYLYPNSSLYIYELENFMLKKYEKRSIFILESGILFSDINLFSKNSYIVIKNDDAYFRISKSRSIIDKSEEFSSKIFCLDGSIIFRPYSQKFDFFERKKDYEVSSSIERLLNSVNVLYQNQSTEITSNDKKKFDIALSRIYQSKNTKFINKDFIKNSLPITIFKNENINFTLPDFDISKFDITNEEIEFISPDNGDFYYNNIKLEKNKRYLLPVFNQQTELVNDLGYTKLIYLINNSNNGYKLVKIKNLTGVSSIKINDKEATLFLEKSNRIKHQNYQFYKVTNNYEYIKNIYVKSDIDIQKIYLLLKKDLDISNFFKIGKINLNGEMYNIYDYGFDDKKNIFIQMNDKINDDILNILFLFDESYSVNL